MSKVLVLPFYPVGLTLVLLAAAFVLFRFNKKRMGSAVLAGAGLVLALFSFVPVSYLLLRSLESRYEPHLQCKKAQAIVLLGGSEIAPSAPRLYDETNAHGDRIFHAARLLKQGCAPVIIATGGKNPFFKEFDGYESEVTFRILTRDFGVDSGAIILEKHAKNTHDNGVFTKVLMDSLGLQPEVLLVTSAFHMPRSVAVFEKAGFTVHPEPTDFFEDRSFQFKPFNFRFDADALNKSTIFFHEFYGVIAYKVLGWI